MSEPTQSFLPEGPIVNDLVLPTGEVVNLRDPASCADALAKIREIESVLRDLKGAAVDALAAESQRQGTKTFSLADGSKVEVRGGEKVVWDAQQLEADLREAGMPEERIREIVVEEVSWTVAAREAKKAASANPAYGEAVERARNVLESRPTIVLSRG